MTKPISYDTIMALSEKEISELFPNGAVEGKKGWQPAEKLADRTLKKLLQDKRKRIEKPRYLHANAARPPTTSIEMALGYRTARTRDKLTGRRTEPEPQMVVTKEDEERFAADARERFDKTRAEELARRELRTCLARLRQIEIAHIKATGKLSPIGESVVAQLQEDRAA